MNPRSPSDLHLPTKKPEPPQMHVRVRCSFPPALLILRIDVSQAIRWPKLAAIRGSALAALLRQEGGGRGRPCPVPFHLTGPNPITLPQAAPDTISGAGKRKVAGGRGWDASFACPAPATLADQARGEVCCCFKHPSVICSGAP